MSELPQFTAPRLILRAVDEADIPSWTENFVDYEVIRFLSSIIPWPYPENGVAEFFNTVIVPQRGINRWHWGIFLKESPAEMVGAVDLWRDGKPEHRGFWLARRLWSQGLMTEAVEPVMDYAFNQLGFEVLVFANAVGNPGSRRIKEKTGARLIGKGPAKFVDPALTEHETWELNKQDPQAFKNLREPQ